MKNLFTDSGQGTLTTGSREVFRLNSLQCSLLVAFEQTGSPAALADYLSRDASVISRQLKEIASLAPVLKKEQGMWRLTDLGRELNRWTRQSAAAQHALLQNRQEIKIAAPAEIVRILFGETESLYPADGEPVRLNLVTSESSVEKWISEGRANLGVEWRRPTDPRVRFQAIGSCQWVNVATPALIASFPSNGGGAPEAMPYLKYARGPFDFAPAGSLHVSMVSNDACGVLQGCLSGLGWTTLPLFMVRQHLEMKDLEIIPGTEPTEESLAVWYWCDNPESKPALAESAELLARLKKLIE